MGLDNFGQATQDCTTHRIENARVFTWGWVMAVPNMQHIVEQIRNEFPEAWINAHTGSARTLEFIRLLAARLNTLDARFGLNGKRGDPNNLSADAINFIGEGVGYDPTRNNNPITVIDVIARAGTPEAAPAWQVLNDPKDPAHVGPGAWVSPTPVSGTGPTGPSIPPPPPPRPTPPPVTPYKGDAYYVQTLGVPLESDYGEKGQTLNAGTFTWVGRMLHDIAYGDEKGVRLTAEQAVAKHRNTWRAVLGLPPL